MQLHFRSLSPIMLVYLYMSKAPGSSYPAPFTK